MQEVRSEREQHTLRHSIGCVGVGLHTGARVALTLHPAPADHGITFRRTESAGGVSVRAHCSHVCDESVSTTLVDPSGRRIAGIEHLMAALTICGIDNVLVEVAGPEVPAMDGSARPFVFLIECAGSEAQGRPRPVIELLRPLEVESGQSLCRLAPAADCSYHCRIEDACPTIGIQEVSLAFDHDRMRQELAPARGYVCTERLEHLLAKGLAKGMSLKNTLMLSSKGVHNEEGLRFEGRARPPRSP